MNISGRGRSSPPSPPSTFWNPRPRRSLTVKKLRLDLPPRGTAHAHLLIPDGAQHRPAVLVLSADGETATTNTHTGADLAQGPRGARLRHSAHRAPGRKSTPTGYDRRRVPAADVPRLCGGRVRESSRQPARMDPARIGVVGHAYGGKWAMFASCLCDRFACAVWSEAGSFSTNAKPRPTTMTPGISVPCRARARHPPAGRRPRPQRGLRIALPCRTESAGTARAHGATPVPGFRRLKPASPAWRSLVRTTRAVGSCLITASRSTSFSVANGASP